MFPKTLLSNVGNYPANSLINPRLLTQLLMQYVMKMLPRTVEYPTPSRQFPVNHRAIGPIAGRSQRDPDQNIEYTLIDGLGSEAAAKCCLPRRVKPQFNTSDGRSGSQIVQHFISARYRLSLRGRDGDLVPIRNPSEWKDRLEMSTGGIFPIKRPSTKIDERGRSRRFEPTERHEEKN
ncbi:hypothetical protein GWI33_000375 [Rhynchophorus ferrugineus]|uniref:Uncharacterized protein n=1 Tax=Rhynchophorus ferrugineus TaxID=354439 RepID=A0A834ITE0_RHYFE|nr:hypothetical protein GWI33_000375 [Rhynchophorus ferrugineus]